MCIIRIVIKSIRGRIVIENVVMSPLMVRRCSRCHSVLVSGNHCRQVSGCIVSLCSVGNCPIAIYGC